MIQMPVGPTRRVFIARQPIFDARNHVRAYELLFRGDAVVTTAEDLPHRSNAATVIDDLLGMDLMEITGGYPAFINVDRATIVEGAVELFDPAHVVIEILEDVTPDAEVVEAVERLIAAGYRIALDDFAEQPGIEELMVLAGVIKIDVLQYDDDGLARVVDRARPYGAALLAEKVEDAAAHHRCLDLGFDLFQGFHFSRPQTLERKELSVDQLNVMRLLNVINDSETCDVHLEDIFRGDVSLSYKLLRMVNSAAMGGRGISSIGHAIRLLGRRSLYRWLALMLASGESIAGPRGEMVHSALLRARMAETLAVQTGRAAMAPTFYLCGLFSRLDVLLHAPMEDLLERVDLKPEVYQALAGRRGPLAPILALVESYEAGEWLAVPARVRSAGADGVDLRDAYVEALQDADRYLNALNDGAGRGEPLNGASAGQGNGGTARFRI